MTEQELTELRRIVSELSKEVINKERNRLRHGYVKEAYFYSGQYLAFCTMLNAIEYVYRKHQRE